MNTSNVSAAKPKKGGAIWRAPKGTALPTTVAAQLDTEFKNLGYVSEDGITNSNSPESDNRRAWGGDVVLNTIGEKPDTFSMTLIESLNIDVLKAVYGDSNVIGDLTTGITIKANNVDLEESAWVIDMLMKDGAAKRIVIPQGKLTELSEINYNDSDAIGYGITISTTPDVNGNNHYEYIIKQAAAQQ